MFILNLQGYKEMYNNGDRDLHNEIRVDCELLLLNNMEK